MPKQPLIQAIFYNNPDGYPPIINGTRLLAQAGFALDLLCREYGQRWDIVYPTETRVQRIGTGTEMASWREYLGFVVRVLGQAQRHADLFLGHDMHGFLPARLLATLCRRPLVYHCHDFVDIGQSLRVGRRIVRAFERRFAHTADLVIVPDKERSLVIMRELHLPQLPLVAANAPISPTRASGEVLTEALSALGYRFSRILFRQGRIAAGHAIEATIRSIPLWVRKEWGFVVMGMGDRAYLASLKRLADELGVADQFATLPPVSYHRVTQFTSGAHVGHALYEPIHVNNLHITTASNKLMEYMGTGLPSIVSDTPALRSLLERYHCGLAADESSPASIAHAVNILLGDPDLSRRMGAAAAEAFSVEFNYERQFAPVIAAFRALANGETRGSAI